MNVRCQRCGTDYEFDDALVSARGTTVKCTTCGLKFKIVLDVLREPQEDGWKVEAEDGRFRFYSSLRELQRAIQSKEIARTDLLTRGSIKRKPIGEIVELQAFFDSAMPTRSERRSCHPPPQGVTVPGLAPPRQRMSTRSDYPPSPSTTRDYSANASFGESQAYEPPNASGALRGGGGPVQREHGRASSPPSAEAKRPVSLTPTSSPPSAEAKRPVSLTPTSSPPSAEAKRPVSLTPTSSPPSAEAKRPVSLTPTSERRSGNRRFVAENPPRLVSRPTQGQPAHRSEPPVSSAEGSRLTPLPPSFKAPSVPHPSEPPAAPRMDVSRPTPLPPPFEASSPLPPPSLEGRASAMAVRDFASSRESLPDVPHSMGRRRSVGGFVVAAIVAAGALLIGAIWAKNHFRSSGSPSTAEMDSRVVGFVRAGEKALADGNLDIAKENFDKASALAEKDPHVLLDAAALAAARADVPWLKFRMLAADARDESRLVTESLAELSAVARRAADDAVAVAPNDPAALRVRIDALRIAGDRSGARALLSKLGAAALQPETAYVLAALDLADDEPVWATVIERLRVAVNAEPGPGRARVALAYALARSGDILSARVEIERLASMPRQHPLLPQLRSFVERSKPATRVDALPDGLRAPAGNAREKPLPSEPFRLVQMGRAAQARGDYDRAQTLFSAALERHPNDADALSGLASIAHSRRDLDGARATYKRILASNPGYVPALVGLGDVEFESGDLSAAMKTYRDIVSRFPANQYPSRVRERLEPNGSSASVPQPSAETPAPVAPVSSAEGETE